MSMSTAEASKYLISRRARSGEKRFRGRIPPQSVELNYNEALEEKLGDAFRRVMICEVMLDTAINDILCCYKIPLHQLTRHFSSRASFRFLITGAASSKNHDYLKPF